MHPAFAQFITPDDPAFSHVWDFANPSGFPQSTNPSTFTWVNPSPELTSVTNVGFGPYIGYMRGGRGHAALAMAYELYRRTGRDVYVLTIAMGGAAIKYWQSGTPIIKALLENFVPYVLANTPALAGITAPDIIIWAQGEANALATADPYAADYLLPNDYKDKWLSVFESGKNIWYDPAISRVLLMEPTQYANWTGTPFGEPGDVSYDYPFRWEGMNAVARHTDEHVKLVSSIGIPWETTGSGAYIHHSGDGLNQYGRRLADAIMGDDVASSVPSSELSRELAPALGGDLDADNHDVSAETVSAGSTTTSSGVCTSTVPNSAPAVGHAFDTPAYTTPGSSLLVVRNDGIAKITFDKDGGLHCKRFSSSFFGGLSLFPDGLTSNGLIGIATGSLASSVANFGSNIAWDFNTVNTMSGSTKHTRCRNNNTEIASLSHSGLPGFFGVTAPTAQTTSGTRVGVTSAGDTLEAIASNQEFRLRIPETEHYGRAQNSGLCGCMILVQNRVLTDIGEPVCVH